MVRKAVSQGADVGLDNLGIDDAVGNRFFKSSQFAATVCNTVSPTCGRLCDTAATR